MTSGHVHNTYIIFLCLFFAITCSANSTHAGCAFVSVGASTGQISFGAIDPSSSGTILGTVAQQVSFTCDNNKNFTVTANPVSGWTLISGANSMRYTLGFITGGTGGGGGAAARIDLLTNMSQILQSGYQDTPSGVYNNGAGGQVTLTINCPTCSNPKTIVATIPATTGVTASITRTCASAVNGWMVFNIDPSGSELLTANTPANGVSPSAKCTKNAALAVSCSSAHASRLTIGNDGVTDPIAYTIQCPATITGNGFSTATPIPVGITVLQTDYQNAQAGPHSDAITVTVTY